MLGRCHRLERPAVLLVIVDGGDDLASSTQNVETMTAPLSGDRVEQIRRFFAKVVDLPADERAAFLKKACSSDPTLRRELTPPHLVSGFGSPAVRSRGAALAIRRGRWRTSGLGAFASPGYNRAGLSIRPEGRRIAFVGEQGRSSELWAIRNFVSKR